MKKRDMPVAPTNTAVASSPNFDPNVANNSATVTAQIFGNRK
jgi:hypothetical protein